MPKKTQLEEKADRLEKAYGKLEELFYGWEHFGERELFDELAKRARAYLKTYDKWVAQFEG